MAAGLIALGYGAAMKAEKSGKISTLAELQVKLVEEEEYEGTLYVRYPRTDKRNRAPASTSYRWIEFSANRLALKRTFQIINGQARFELMGGQQYRLVHLDTGKQTLFKWIPCRLYPKWQIIAFQHAVTCKPIPHFLAANIARRYMYQAIYRRNYKKGQHMDTYQFPGYYKMPIKPLHQMMVLAMQECETEGMAPKIGIFQEWWDKNKLDVLPKPFPDANKLHLCLKDPSIIYDYYSVYEDE
jgi:hypothetical protein